jgi:putative flavoprotein involved in K+ transport
MGMREPGSEHHATIVIGGGQVGLAAAYELTRRDHDVLVLEARRRIGDTWRDRYESLRLYSPASADSLPGLRFPLPSRSFPTGRQMGDYLEAYVAHHGLPVRADVHVTEVSAMNGAAEGPNPFRITSSQGTFTADQVVVATGGFQHPRVPEFAADLDPAIVQLHSSAYHNPSQLGDGPVLVVGFSHSGADLAHEAAIAGHRTILSGKGHGQLPFPIDSRRGRYLGWPLARFLTTRVLTLRTPIGRKMAPKVRRGGAPLLRIRRPELEAAGVELREARTEGVTEGRPRLADGSVLDVKNVIWCTGFRPDFGWIRLPFETVDGLPAQDRGVVAAVPGLYFLGLPFLSSFASMLVLGAPRDARHVADHIVRNGTRAAALPSASSAA